jgi:hypothetical protein
LQFIDFDARRDPKTDRWCIRCQKDLPSRMSARQLRALLINGAPYSLHPEDEPGYDTGALPLPSALQPGFERDLGQCFIGSDCARAHGLEWTKPL